MHTMRLRTFQEPSRVQQLLDAFVLATQYRSESDRPIRNRSELPSALKRVVARAEGAQAVWNAWQSGPRIRLLTAKLSLECTRRRAVPVLEIRSFDERTGWVVGSGYFVLNGENGWARCKEQEMPPELEQAI